MSQPQKKPVFLTPPELAERWCLSAETLRRWRRERFGPRWVKFGRGHNAPVRYALEEVLWFEQNNQLHAK